MKEDQKLIHLGSCSRPHGIRGGLSVHLFNLKESSLAKGVEVLLRPKNGQSSLSPEGKSFEIESVSFGNKCVVHFNGVESRNHVEELLPFDIFIPRNSLPEPEAGEFYLEDLIGLKVLDEKGEEAGSVKTYFDNGAQTVLAIQKGAEIVELPLVEEFFPEINVSEGFIRMIEPEII